LVTIFDPTTAAALESRLDRSTVTSMADIVAPALAGPCLGESLGAVRMEGDTPVGVRTDGGEIHEEPVELPRRRRGEALLRALLTPYDKSAALMFFGAIGLGVVLLLETAGGVIVLGQNVVDSFYGSTKTLVTVDPNDKVQGGPSWFKAFISVSMLSALVFEAFFTAGLVNRSSTAASPGSSAAARCRGATTSSSSGSARSGCGCACCCAAAASAWSRSTTARRARTSARRARRGCRS
jgi:hypothetical protein